MHNRTTDAEDSASREAPKGVDAWAQSIVQPVPPSVGGNVHVAPFASKVGANPDFEVMSRPFEQRA